MRCVRTWRFFLSSLRYLQTTFLGISCPLIPGAGQPRMFPPQSFLYQFRMWLVSYQLTTNEIRFKSINVVVDTDIVAMAVAGARHGHGHSHYRYWQTLLSHFISLFLQRRDEDGASSTAMRSCRCSHDEQIELTVWWKEKCQTHVEKRREKEVFKNASKWLSLGVRMCASMLPLAVIEQRQTGPNFARLFITAVHITV